MKHLLLVLILLVPICGVVQADDIEPTIAFTGVRMDDNKTLISMGFGFEVADGLNLSEFIYTDIGGEYQNISVETAFLINFSGIHFGPIIGPNYEVHEEGDMSYLGGAVGTVMALDFGSWGVWAYYKNKYNFENEDLNPKGEVWGVGFWKAM